MNHARGWLALIALTITCGPLRAQVLIPYGYQSGYGYSGGGGIGFSYQRGHLGIGGFLGSRYYASGFYGGGFYPSISTRVIVNYYPPPPPLLPPPQAAPVGGRRDCRR